MTTKWRLVATLNSRAREAARWSKEQPGGNVGGHWLCSFCEVTQSASALGAGGLPLAAVQDVAAMLNVLLRKLESK